MKSKKLLLKSLKKIFETELKTKINSKSKIYDFNAWDSLANFNILLSLEGKFKIKFTAKEFNNLNSFQEISKIVQKKI
jgi:acyl carrier protein